MDCKEVLAHISDAVDGRLGSPLEPQVHLHIKDCGKCRNEFELARMTKHIVRHHLRRSATPDAVASNIRARLKQHASSNGVPRVWGFIAWFGQQSWRPIAAFGTLVAAILIYFLIPSSSHHTHASPKDGNIINQVYNNFDGVLRGEIVPEIASSDPQAVRTFFSSKVDFNVSVPRVKEYALVGGSLSHYDHENLAHVVYKHGNDVVYLYQVNLSCAMNGQTIHLPPEAKAELLRTGWYMENHLPDCSLIVWVVDSTLCCGIADMKHDQLLAFFQSWE